MVLWGFKSQDKCPRWHSESRWENHDFDRAASAAVGTGAMPTNSLGLTSSSAAFATPVSFPRRWSRRRVTAPDAPTVAVTDLSLIAFPYLNGLGK
jgi:hypothetical protein